jgi:hypothetical protein
LGFEKLKIEKCFWYTFCVPRGIGGLDFLCMLEALCAVLVYSEALGAFFDIYTDLSKKKKGPHMKKCYMLEFIKEISFDKLKNIYEKQKFGKCFQHIKETRKKKKKKKRTRWRLASMGGSRHPLSLRGRATKQICGHHDGCHADPTATTTP